MKKLGLLLLVLASSGCAIASGFSMYCKTADDLKSELRKSIVDEAVARSVEKCQEIQIKERKQ